MILSVLTLHLPGVEISMPPLTWEHDVLIGAAALLAYGFAWLIRGFKIRSLRKAAARSEATHAEVLAAQHAEARSQAIEYQRRVDDAVADRSVLEQRFTLHREATQRHDKEAQDVIAALDAEIASLQDLVTQMEPAKARINELEVAHAVLQERLTSQTAAEQRRASEAQARIAALESDLAAAREISAQLQPTKSRIGDLEAMVASERERRESLEKNVTAATQRAEDLETRLRAAQQKFDDYETQARQRYAALAQDLADREQANAADRIRFEKGERELAKMHETYTSYQQQAETRIANLQRSLSAAEAKTTVVQKELMGAFGVMPAALPVSSANGDKNADKRTRELEDRIAQIEAEGRKKAREDSYRIAELEYRLIEAHEALTRPKGDEGKAPPSPPPLPPKQNP